MKKDLYKILAKTNFNPNSNCFEWLGALNTDGYPRAVVDGNSNAKLHRVVFELAKGFLPEVVRHSCDNPKCLNPNHLLAGTARQNTLDRHERGRNAKTRGRPSRKLVEQIWSDRALGTTDLSRKYGMSKNVVKGIKSGKTYRWLLQQED